MKFSLILATLGRYKELEIFLCSLINQSIGSENFEIIVVDQNDVIDISPVISRFQRSLKIIHLKSSVKGLSFNRNVGLSHATGEYICFPDDDCEYYPDTLESVFNLFQENKIDVCLGRIRNRQLRKDIIRRWPTRIINVKPWNFFRLTSSVTIFARRNEVIFDEKMGVGAYFGGSEDADYLWQLMERGRSLKYFPQIEVNHPDQNASLIPQEKLNSYMRGFGALIRKHPSFSAFKLLTMAAVYYFFLCLIALLKLDLKAFKRRWLANVHCLRGLLHYGR